MLLPSTSLSRISSRCLPGTWHAGFGPAIVPRSENGQNESGQSELGHLIQRCDECIECIVKHMKILHDASILSLVCILGLGCDESPAGPQNDGDVADGREEENSPDAVLDADGGAGEDREADSEAGGDDGSGVESDGDVSDADAGEPPPVPEDYRPCEAGVCWDTSANLWRCGSGGIDQDFSSGSYNVHDYASRVYAGALNTITVDRSAGAWQPAIIVAEEDGTVLSDGLLGLIRPGLGVSVVSDGTTGERARVDIDTGADLSVHIFVTGWEVVRSGFIDFLPRDAAYALTVENNCGGPVVDCVVNGHTVAEPACGWLHYVARDVVPLLEGSRDQRLTDAARVAWWSLKEDVIYRSNPLVYSNCGYPSGNNYIGPLETCHAGYAWQVGLPAVQVPGFALDELEATALRLFPGETVDEVLEGAAREALLDEATTAAVVASIDDLRRSWLLRTSAVGFTIQEPVVTDECIDHSRPFCYGTGWDTTRWFAPDRESALGAIDDVRAILEAVAP